MYLLLTDETNVAAAANVRFFASGGLIVPMDRLASLDAAIAAARLRHGYRLGDALKFDTNTRPDHVTRENATAIKRVVVDACRDAGCTLLLYVVLHRIARYMEAHRTVEFAANTVIGRFNAFLTEKRSHGIVVVDRQPNAAEFDHLARMHSHGLTIDGRQVRLDRIHLFASSCINASHVSSAIDIALGSFRYCINVPRNLPAARSMLRSLSEMLWGDRDGEVYHVIEKGFVMRPRTVTRADYRAEYDALLAHINGLLGDQQAA